MAGLELSPQLFAIFANLVEEASGIHHGPRDRELFASKLATHAVDAGYDNLLDYYYRLRYDDPTGIELRALVDRLVVHETYFFRELAPLRQLAHHLATVVRDRGHARLWSAACSTGEEPLTMAMLLAERDILSQVEIIGTDLSEGALARARSGRHGRRSLREGHPVELARRFLETSAQGVSVAPGLRDAVQFRRLNLLDDEATRELGVFDVILCRNVLIYFSDAQIVRVVERLTRALSPGGLLAVGVSESLLRFGTSLACEERGGCFVYRRAP